MKKLKIAVFASHGGSNLQAIIDACKSKRINAEVAVVISNNSESLALERARNENIPAYHISAKKYTDANELDSAILGVLQKYDIELIALAGYMRKLGESVIRTYKGRILNIHPALLPKYGGKGMYGNYVHEAVLKAGDKETGVTIHLVDEEYDNGAILNQCEVEVKEDDDVESLAERVLEREHKIYVETLKMICDGRIKLEYL